MLPAFLSTVLYSFSALFAQRTARALGGITANFWRLVIATLLLGAWSHAFGIGLQGAALPWFFVSGLVGFGVGDVALFQAYPRVGSRIAIMIVHCLAAPTAALVEFLWLGTRLTAAQMVCIAVSLGGVTYALAPGKQAPERHPQFGAGVMFSLVAMMGQSLGAVFSRKANSVAVAMGQLPPPGVNAAYQRVLGGLLVALITYGVYRAQCRLSSKSILTPSSLDPHPPSRRRVFFWVFCNTLAGPVLGVSCFQWALATQPTGIVLPIVALTPLVIIPFAHWMEGERTRWQEIIGGAIAVTGVATLARLSQTL